MLLSGCLALLALLAFYIYWNDRAIHHVPEEVLGVSPHRWTAEEVRDAYRKQLESPQDILSRLPPKTGRKYIVVGGAGFLGGWIVVHLIRRGEDPRNIRIVDIQRPTRRDLLTGPATQVEFMQVDVADRDAVFRAFRAPWPTSTSKPPDDSTSDNEDQNITVFHTAANIRFFERHPAFLPRSTRVNLNGAQNVIDAARDIGVDIFLYTSSGAILVHSNRFWLWPWERRPKYFVQALNDDDNLIPKEHSGFFSNYAASKALGEQLVRSANKLSTGQGEGKILRTGCLRPGNGVFGPGGDMLCGAALVRRNNPTWIPDIVHNFLYVENGSLAHLCYEQKLIQASSPSSTATVEDLSGRAYCICDVGPPPTYGDVYRLMNTLTDGEVYFPTISPTLMLLVAQFVEAYHLLQSLYLPALLPPIKGDIINVQPSLFSLVQTHLIFDDSRARRELGYEPVWTTMEGLCKTVQEHDIEERLNEEEARSSPGGATSYNGKADMAGFSFDLCWRRKKKRLAKMNLPEVKSIAVPR